MNQLSQTDVAVYGMVAAALPALVAVFNRPHFPGWLKQLIMLVVALLAGGVTYGLKNGWDFSSRAGVITALIGVWIATQTAYLVFWKQALAPAIESSVNSGSKAPKHAADPDPAPNAVIEPATDDVEPPADDYNPQPDDEDYTTDEPDGYTDPIPEGAQLGPADKETTSA